MVSSDIPPRLKGASGLEKLILISFTVTRKGTINEPVNPISKIFERFNFSHSQYTISANSFTSHQLGKIIFQFSRIHIDRCDRNPFLYKRAVDVRS